MPKIKGAKKALRQSKKRAIQNKNVRKAFKEVVKKFRKTVDAGNAKEATQQLALAYKALDKAAKTNVIKKNTASRLKSRLAQYLAKKTK